MELYGILNDKQVAAIEKALEPLRNAGGHEDFLPTALKQMVLHAAKNSDYASGGHPLGNFNRVAAIFANYPNLRMDNPLVVALCYAMKQIDAVLWGLNSNITHKVEGNLPRLDDVAVYANIAQCIIKEQTRNKDIERQFGTDLIPEGEQADVRQRRANTVPSDKYGVAEAMEEQAGPSCPDIAKTQDYKCVNTHGCDYPETCRQAHTCVYIMKDRASRRVEVSACGVRDLTPDGRYMEREEQLAAQRSGRGSLLRPVVVIRQAAEDIRTGQLVEIAPDGFVRPLGSKAVLTPRYTEPHSHGTRERD